MRESEQAFHQTRNTVVLGSPIARKAACSMAVQHSLRLYFVLTKTSACVPCVFAPMHGRAPAPRRQVTVLHDEGQRLQQSE